MKKMLAMGLAVASAVTLMACQKTPEKKADAAPAAGAPAAAGMPLVGVTIYKYDDNFMSFVRRAIEGAAGGKAELSMQDSQNDQGKQNGQVDALIAKGAKVLAINLVDPQAAATIVSKASAAKIPVVFFNKEPMADVLKSCEKCWYVGTTSSESGIMQGKLIAESWKAHPEWDKNKDGKIQFVLLKGEPGHPDAEARTKFVIDELNKEGVQTEQLELQTGMWDTAKANNLMDAWLAKHGDKIEYVIANNDGMALGAINALQGKGYFKDPKKFMPVVGVDAIPDALAKIKEGVMVGSVLNDAKNQGLATFQLALNAANGKDPLDGTTWKFDDKKSVRVPYVLINKDNLKVAEDAYN
ncbi:galactose/glucose ABC transporter substrate-binding protein MglB [Hydromonas duriensis]|uniref:D-galactose/methyl-galactoside binding periplasmic protein MglB n=1 Tax=Hydromonas duriensis TaxID=1527608 RepID=A0A4R6YAZ7_9BURK|nr:galactose/glucose ABC transporter substrate-binding protein MglB [Hydromonas duriensis]TDR32740.1 methyl-galactoside transport system substrate-binding protein [Hydromonas duriensis]